MLQKYRTLLKIVWDEDPVKFLLIQILLVINALFELLGIASVTPLLGLMLSPEKFHESKIYPYITTIKNILKIEDDTLLLSSFSLFCIIIGTCSSIFSKIIVQRFSFKIGEKISSRLLRYYLNLDYIEHAVSKSSFFIRNVLQESNRLVTHILNPLMQINVSLVVLIIVLSLVCFVNPLFSIVMFFLVGSAFLGFYLFSKKMLHTNSKDISDAGNAQYSTINQGFSGIKDIKLYSSEESFVGTYREATKKINAALLRNFSIMIIPGHMLQMGIFVFIIIIALILHFFKESNFIELPELMFFSVAGYKILPSINTIYSNISTTQGNITAYDRIAKDLVIALTCKENNNDFSNSDLQSLLIRDVSFSYNKEKLVLHGIDASFFNGKVYGIAGPSGSGKTTLIDIISGLLKPSQGHVLVNDHQNIEQDALRSATSYVSQSAYIIDGTFLENICFGQEPVSFNRNAAEQALIQAGLSSFSLDDQVGEAGKSLSGGQKQRLGIARALYRNKALMIFDESTSALDGVTEHEIIQNILRIKDEKIIFIVAHRLTTLRACDEILVLEKGKVSQQGNYSKLIEEKNGLFWEMATKGGFEK